jgi:hypothetical protein
MTKKKKRERVRPQFGESQFYPDESLVGTYEGHVRKWESIVNSVDEDRLRNWKRINPLILWSIVIDVTDVVQRMIKSSPFYQSQLPRDLHSLILYVRTNNDHRLEVQRVMLDTYVDLIENTDDYELDPIDRGIEGRETEWVRIRKKWKWKVIYTIDELHWSDNNPFDVVWFMGTNQFQIMYYLKKFMSIVVILLGISIVLIRSFVKG